MAITNELDAWKVFLKGRILQEKGDNQEALSCFENALRIDPDNSSFLNAKAAALRGLGKGQEATVARLKGQYRELAQALIGDNDKPGDWLKAIEKLETEVDQGSAAAADALTVVW